MNTQLELGLAVEPVFQKWEAFTKELEGLINKYSLENGSDTPDFLLAEYLTHCLQNFNRTVSARGSWHTDK